MDLLPATTTPNPGANAPGGEAGTPSLTPNTAPPESASAWEKNLSEALAGFCGQDAGNESGAVSQGNPYLVPVGDSIVLVAKTEAFNVIHDRLRYLRRWEAARRRKEGGESLPRLSAVTLAGIFKRRERA